MMLSEAEGSAVFSVFMVVEASVVEILVPGTEDASATGFVTMLHPPKTAADIEIASIKDIVFRMLPAINNSNSRSFFTIIT